MMQITRPNSVLSINQYRCFFGNCCLEFGFLSFDRQLVFENRRRVRFPPKKDACTILGSFMDQCLNIIDAKASTDFIAERIAIKFKSRLNFIHCQIGQSNIFCI